MMQNIYIYIYIYISVIPVLSDKVLSGTKTDFSYTQGRMCGYELFAPGKTTGYSYYIELTISRLYGINRNE